MDVEVSTDAITGFVWLEQYVEKLAWKHDVTPEEVEAIFFARPTFRLVEKGHIHGENMYSAMAQTEEGRYVIAFFIHKLDGRALIISARTMDEAEETLWPKIDHPCRAAVRTKS